MKIKAYIIFCILLSSPSFATTWSNIQVQDPILKNEKCDVATPRSYGSYIYHWPSKYDQVFWPHTTGHGIWFCKKSGFTAFIGDFKNLSPNEILAIKKYLRSTYKNQSRFVGKLELLEGVYKLRKKKKFFKNHLLRVLAYNYEQTGNIKKATEYRKTALTDMESALKGKLPANIRLTYLYVIANYHREFANNKKSDQYLEKLLTAMKSLKDKKYIGFAQYLKKLSTDTKKITPGGKLMPSRK